MDYQSYHAKRRRYLFLTGGGNETSPKAVPRSGFDRLFHPKSSLESLTVERVEWFSNQSGDLLGTIARGRHFAAWEQRELFTKEMPAAFKSLR
jgi:hypothetical protein